MNGGCWVNTDETGFTPEQIAACVQRQGLLSIEIEIQPLPATPGTGRYDGSEDAVVRALDQAAALGARSVALAGRPLAHPQLHAIIDHARQLGLAVELGAGRETIDADDARFFHERGVGLVLEVAQWDARRQDVLDRTASLAAAGVLHLALPVLCAAGYPDPHHALALGIRLNQSTMFVLLRLWRWTRAAGLKPLLEINRPQVDCARHDYHPDVAPSNVAALLAELARIDQAEFGRSWVTPPAAAARSCRRHLYSCHVSHRGIVYACTGLMIPLGNLSDEPLGKILQDSEVLEDLRNYQAKIKAPCRECSDLAACYGCRGAAMHLTGDYLAADPLCPRVDPALVQSLPVDVGGLIPHGPSMRLVDCIVRVGEREAVTEYVVPPRGAFVNTQGMLDDAAYIEMIAQSLAAWYGFHLSSDEQEMHRGLLLGVRDLTLSAPARAGDRLRIRVRKLARLGGLGVAEGAVCRAADGREVARAEVKVWQSSSDPAGATR
jgi:radical SAM protein with 4Fe4S-binding SPASM domain